MNKFVLIITSILFFTVKYSQATIYYSQVSVGGGRDVTQLSNWKTSVGGGTSPSSFGAGDEFHIANADSMTSSALWTISGGGKLVIENNGKFNASGFDHSLTLDMQAGAFYYVKSSYNNLILGSIDLNSTMYVLYVPSGTLNHLRYNVTYPGNLTLDIETSSTTYVSLGSVTNLNVNGNLNINSNSSSNTFTVVRSISFNIGGNLNILKSTFQSTYNSYTPIFNIAGNLNISGGIFIGSAYAGAPTFNITGSFNLSGGTFYGTSGGATGNPQFNISGSFNQTGGTYTGLAGTGSGRITFNMNGTGNINTLNLGAGNHNVIISGNITMINSFIVGENLTLNSGSLSIGNNILTLNKQLFVVSGSLIGGTASQITFGTSSVDASLPAVTLGTLLINRAGQTVTMVGNVIIANSLQLSSGNLSISNNTLTLNSDLSGSGAIIGGSTSNLTIGVSPSGAIFNFPTTALTLNNLNVNRSAAVILNAPVSINGNLILTKGSINNSSQVLTLGNGATITRYTCSLSSAPTFSGNYNLIYNGSTSVNTGNELYFTSPNILDNFTINNTSGVTLNKNFEVNQNLTINSGGIFKASNYTIQSDLNWVNNGTFTPGTSTVIFNGNSVISGTPSGGHNFYSISIAAGASLTAPLSGNVNISNNFTIGAASTFNHNTGTITFTGSGSQTIPAVNYYNLVSTGTGSRILSNAGIMGIAGAFTSGSNTYTVTGSTVNFNGSSSQNIPLFTFDNLTVSGTSVKTLNTGNIGVNSVLTFSNATISTGANKVIMGANGSVVGAGSGNYVYGNLQKNFSIGSGVSRTFEIGNSTNYLPITATFATVTIAGNITASTSDGDYSQIASSCIDPSKSVNRFWTLTNSGISPSNYNVILNFLSGDIDAGANYNNFEGSLYNGSSWQNLTSGSKTSTSISFTGVTNFGIFQVGESTNTTTVSVSIAASPSTAICPGSSATFTATPVNGGSNPSYAWVKNGSSVGSNSATYIDPSLNIGDVISVNMVSNSPCAFQPNATSNSLTITNSGGCSYTWTGAVSSVWTTAMNWNPSVTPDSTDDVTIPSGTPNNPAVAGSVKVRNVTINSGATLTLNSSSTFQVFGNFINNGTFTDAGATTVFSGTAAQSITGASTFSSLTLNNALGLTLNSNVGVVNILSLLKGTLTTNGFLTVDLNTGNIAYNATDNGSISGNMLVKKNVNNTNTHYLGCPLSGVTANDFNDDTQVINPSNGKTRLFTFNANTQSYVGITNLNTALSQMTGYSLYFISPVPKVLDFTGSYAHGATYSAITCPNTTHNSILVGNPYPSTLDWTIASGWSKTGISDGIYFWDAPNLRYASYVNGSSVNGGTPYVPALQGFFVFTDSTSGGTASIAINNNARTTSQTPALWRKGLAENTLNIKLSGGRFSDESLIRFENEATDQFDRSLDAFKIINPDSTPSVYTCDSRNIYSINTLSKGDKVIPLHVKAGFSGLYTLSLVNSGLDFASNLVLEDKVLNTKKKLSSNDQYVFTVNDGDRADRFTLYINNSSNKGALSGKVLIGSYDKTVNLTFNNAGNTADIKIYNIVGQEVESIENADISSGIYSYSNSELKEGIYVVKVLLGNEFYTGKVYIK